MKSISDERSLLSLEIKAAFSNWCEEWLLKPFSEGGFGYLELQPATQAKDSDAYNLISTFVGPEADIQMHFGSFLFQHLARLEMKDNWLTQCIQK